MDLEGFRDSIRGGQMPEGLGPCLSALWVEARGEWDRAHELVQSESGEDAAWIHAYLHRKEGDLSNARYWYSRASRPPVSVPHDEEWAAIASELLARR